MAHFHVNALVGASGQQGYQISRSLRFNSADSAYLNRTPASAGNRRTFTWSGWVKRSKLGDENKTFTAGSSGTITYLQFQDNVTDGLTFGRYTGTHTFRLSTTQVFRDSSAWYHITLAVDTTQATDTNRVKIYVNGTQITVFTTATYPAQNLDLEINNTNDHRIGIGTGSFSGSGYLDGYLTEINFIDGQALTPSSFGETDTITGVWKPKKYAGTYGTNGFYLNFSDNSGTTSTTLGKDSSGNSNNWTPNNFSVTAGAGNDSLIDTPTPYADGGNGRGNYPTANPLDRTAGNGTSFSNGNLDVVLANASVRGTIGIPSSGKWYFEWTITKVYVDAQGNLGIAGGVVKAGTTALCGVIPATASNPFDVGGIYKNGSKVQSVLGLSVNDVFSVAIDMDALTLQAYRNGTTFGSSITLDSAVYIPHFSGNGTSTGDANTAALNFGQRPFAYTPPSGFVALNTQNLPEPSIKKPSSYFDVKLYTGTNATQSITGLNFSPDLVWLKNRSGTNYHGLFDTVRGRAAGLSSNVTDAESTSSAGNDLASFDANGFTVGPVQNWGSTNTSSASIVAWCWDESATPGFDIVTYTGNASNAARSVAHSLGVAPQLMITKGREAQVTGTDNWLVWHGSFGAGDFLSLNTTSAKSTSSSYWGNTVPTSSNFYVGGTSSNVHNESSKNYVAYLWSEVAGFSKFGSYTGNGSSDGPFVFLGFKPRFILFKNTTNFNWQILDTARADYNQGTVTLFPNLSNAENTTATQYDILSNGFKIRTSDAGSNGSGNSIIFAAFAENPFKYALAR
jgi:hypothetical protein